MQDSKNIKSLFEKKVNNTINKEEQDLLNAWLLKHKNEQAAGSILAEIMEEIPEQYSEDIFKSEEKAWQELETRVGIGTEENAGKVISLKPQRFLFSNFSKIAAVVTLLLVAFIWFTQVGKFDSDNQLASQEIEQKTLNGQRKFLSLPDGTKVKLNSNTSIRFSKPFQSGGERIVYLTGEAFFDVTKNKNAPFKVITESLEVKVLGTSFNVKANSGDESVKVSLVEGKVNVYNKENNESSRFNETIEPNESITLNRTTGKVGKGRLGIKDVAWKDNIIYFDETDFDDIVHMLESWYGVSFILPKNEKIELAGKYVGKFEDKSLREVLEGLSYSIKFEYKMDSKNKLVYITKTE